MKFPSLFKNILSRIRIRIPAKFLRKRILIPAILTLIVIVAALTLTTNESVAIATAPVREGPFLVSIKVSGEIRAAQSFTLTAPRGRFAQSQIVFLIPEGTTVATGDTVIRFSTTEIDKVILEKDAELSLLESDYKKMQADQESRMEDLKSNQRTSELALDQARLQLEKVKFEAEVARKESEINFERSKLNLEQAKRRIESQRRVDRSEDMKARLRKTQVRSDLDRAHNERAQLIMKAPMPGLVVYEMNWQTNRKIAIGDSPWPGMSLVSLPDLSKMQTVLNVNEVDVSKVSAGQKAIVRLDAFPDRSFNAVVASVGTIGQLKDRASNIKTFEVVLMIDEKDPILKPGMSTSNEIVMATIPKAKFVPMESVFERDGEPVVYAMDGSSPRPLTVQTGERNSNFIVVEGPLHAGQRVALRDPSVEPDRPGTDAKPAAKR